MSFLPWISLFFAAQPGVPVSWNTQSAVQRDGTVLVELIAEVEEGWHLYATRLESDQGPLPTVFRFAPSEAYAVSGELLEPAPKEEFDPNFGMTVRYHSGSPRFAQAIKPVGRGGFIVKGEVEYMVCNQKTCLPPKVVPFELTIPALAP